MKVTVEDRSSVKKVLHIEIPEADVTRALDEAYQTLKKTAKVKGFRPGKTPRGVLERFYKKDVNADVAGKLIQDAYVDALKETELKVVGSPSVDPPDLAGKGDYCFDAEVEVHPEIADIGFTNLKLKKTLYKAGDEEVDVQIQMMQKNLAKREPIDEQRPAQNGDFVQVDYEGFKDQKPFEETEKTENFVIKLGDAHIADDFDKGVVGMNPGDEKEITVSFPDEYFNKKLAGHTVDFKVKLNEIRKEVLPEIDDEMAKQLGPFTTLDEVRDKIRENLTQGYDKRIEQELNEQIFSQILETTEFEVPDVMVEYELNSIIADAERSFSYHNKTFEEAGISRESLAEKYRDTAEKQVRRQLILGKIIQQEKMELADEDLEKGFEEMAATYDQPVDVIKGFYGNSGDKLELFKHALLEKQAIKLIMERNEIESVEPEKEAPEA
ncbi:MAG: trigger factor [Desulfobacterales bacterium]|uniref:trigger factor n=1 Tax=Desulfosarcina sp. TaxID=2027861 RepID=UPI0029B9FDA1|nr:trigger factor [Desulfosarcina sp.]MDX2446683.1 trigger factor [Desulfobacterales bacterium]MDX2490784.1 trigger factor [Desulfosarcina sp.]